MWLMSNKKLYKPSISLLPSAPSLKFDVIFLVFYLIIWHESQKFSRNNSVKLYFFPKSKQILMRKTDYSPSWVLFSGNALMILKNDTTQSNFFQSRNLAPEIKQFLKNHRKGKQKIHYSCTARTNILGLKFTEVFRRIKMSKPIIHYFGSDYFWKISGGGVPDLWVLFLLHFYA